MEKENRGRQLTPFRNTSFMFWRPHCWSGTSSRVVCPLPALRRGQILLSLTGPHFSFMQNGRLGCNTLKQTAADTNPPSCCLHPTFPRESGPSLNLLPCLLGVGVTWPKSQVWLGLRWAQPFPPTTVTGTVTGMRTMLAQWDEILWLELEGLGNRCS